MSLGALATSHAEMPSHRVILTHTDLHGIVAPTLTPYRPFSGSLNRGVTNDRFCILQPGKICRG